MNKTKIMLLSAGGVAVVLVLVMGFFVWSSYSAKNAAIDGDEENEGLDSVMSAASQLSRKPVYPSQESVKAIAADIEKLETWKNEAVKLVSRGDRAFAATTAAAFKTFLVNDAKRLQEGFDFGPFKEYIAGGALPDSTQLPKLQRQWDDIALVTEILAANGMQKLTAVDFAKIQEEAPAEEPQPKKGKKAKKAKAKEAVAEFKPAKESYVFTFTISPDGFTKALNALATGERFTVVDDFSFRRQQDVIVTALGGEAKKEAPQGGRRGRRRGAAAQAEEQQEDVAKKNGIVTDPLVDPPLTVTMTVSVYDFGSLEETASVKTEE